MYIEGFPSGFSPSVDVPLDKRTSIADITAADATFLATCYVGLIVFDEATGTHYRIAATDGTQAGLTYTEFGGGGGAAWPQYRAMMNTSGGTLTVSSQPSQPIAHSGHTTTRASQVTLNTGEPELHDLISEDIMLASIPANHFQDGDRVRIRRRIAVTPQVNGTTIRAFMAFQFHGTIMRGSRSELLPPMTNGAGVLHQLIHDLEFTYGEGSNVSAGDTVDFYYQADADVTGNWVVQEVEVELLSRA